MRNCAIIQLEAIHEIVTPGIIYILNQLGYKPTLFFNENCSLRRGNIFDYCQELRFELVEFQLKKINGWSGLEKLINKRDPEFLVINTLQKNTRFELYESLGVPMIGIVHNIHTLLETEQGMDFLRRKDLGLYTIASHVSFFLRGRIGFDFGNVDYYIPSYLLETLNRNRVVSNSHIYRIAIIGGINNIKNRGFDDLISALKLRINKADKFKFIICGGGNDRVKLEEIISNNNLMSYFEFVPVDKNSGYVTYDKYYASIRDSDFLITLFPKDDVKYVKFKATAAIMTAISFGMPIITDNISRTVYDMPCVVYDQNNLDTLFNKINEFSKEEYGEVKCDTLKYRELALKRGVESFSCTLRTLGL